MTSALFPIPGIEISVKNGHFQKIVIKFDLLDEYLQLTPHFIANWVGNKSFRDEVYCLCPYTEKKYGKIQQSAYFAILPPPPGSFRKPAMFPMIQ